MCLYVRDFTAAESRQISAWLKRSRNAVQMRRGQILSFSAQGMRVQEIAGDCDSTWDESRVSSLADSELHRIGCGCFESPSSFRKNSDSN